MKRYALVLLSVLLMAGCATTRSNYYSYDGSGDYYYGAGTTDVVIGSSGYYYGRGGYGNGYGNGFGFGYGVGYGYGYGYPSWGYGYPPIWWAPSYPHDHVGTLRDQRVERDRAMRSSLIRRDTVHSPDSAKRFRDNPQYQRPFTDARRGIDVPAVGSSSPRRTVNPQPTAPIRRAPMMQPQSAPSRSARMPTAPTRSAPPPRPAQRRE